MCRNPSCQNFGIHYEGTTATGNKLFRHQYDTPYGTIEFTHTKRNIPDENDGTVDVGRPLRLATKEVAYQDLKNTRRNLHLVDKEALLEDG